VPQKQKGNKKPHQSRSLKEKACRIATAVLATTTLVMASPQDDIVSGETIAKEANRYIGTPYVYGGNNIKKGIDCSAFVKHLYGEHGYKLPRRAEWQAMDTTGCPTYTDITEAQIGDVLYFRKNKGKGRIHHTAIITGFKNGRPIITHAKGKKYGVVREVISDRYLKELTAIKRFGLCTSALKHKFTEEEVVEAILSISDEVGIAPKTLVEVITALSSLKPLTIYVDFGKEKDAIVRSLKADGVSVKERKGTTSVYLTIDNLFQAQYIAMEFKKYGVQFWAGLMLVSSDLYTNDTISDIFYPSANLEKAIDPLRRCSDRNTTAEILKCLTAE